MIRLLAYPESGRWVAVVVDGVHKRPRTLRGVWRCLGRMVEACCAPGALRGAGKDGEA